MDVNFEYYKIFYYVAKYNNFTKAANILHNSQPNITRAMNCLEQEVNCTLFIRTNRGAFLTPEGERLYTRVSAAMMQIQQAEEELAESVGLEHGSISIGASEIALNIYLLDRLKKFHSHFSKIMFTNPGGEKKHLTFDDNQGFGPDYEPLMEIVAKKGLSPIFVCESAGTQDKDALTMKNYYLSVK